DDDFNTARGIGILFDAVRNLNRQLDKKNDRLSPDILKKLQSDQTDILKIGSILGILYQSPEQYFNQKRLQAFEQQSIDPSAIEKLLQERVEARKAKNWAKADQIRRQLVDMNITLEDRPEGTVWKIG
ncbi:MAG: cysteine--tRNA ligase, partial [Proteobacteria bacterium]|nr:cysteine--tRNA ligase [Pseudomonadota bacterium]